MPSSVLATIPGLSYDSPRGAGSWLFAQDLDPESLSSGLWVMTCRSIFSVGPGPGSPLAMPQASDCPHPCLLSSVPHSSYQQILLGHLQWRGVMLDTKTRTMHKAISSPHGVSYLLVQGERKEIWKQIKYKTFKWM